MAVAKKNKKKALKQKRPWFQFNIPVTMGVDNLMFKTGKMLIEAYYNGYLDAITPNQRWSAIYIWGDVNLATSTIPLTGLAFKVADLPYKTIVQGKNPVTHLLPKSATKMNKVAALKVQARVNKSKGTAATLLPISDKLLKHEIISGVGLPPNHAFDVAPVQPPAPKSPPPPTL